jgi:deazaflavin-dependent oxidoreductase (nitroreductase family)
MNDPNEWNKKIIKEFRENDGEVGGMFAEMALLLLHTTGAKSGLPRVNPMAYLRDGDRLAVVASKGGAPTNPDWYHNVVAHPNVKVEVGTEEYKAVAEVAIEPERTHLFKKMVALNPGFEEYEQKTSRVIPVITLTRQP